MIWMLYTFFVILEPQDPPQPCCFPRGPSLKPTMDINMDPNMEPRSTCCSSHWIACLVYILYTYWLDLFGVFNHILVTLVMCLNCRHFLGVLFNHQIYTGIVRMMILGKSDPQRKNKHKACRYFVYIQHALFYLLCLPLFPCSKLPGACRENDILIKSSWYPSNVLMIICKFWYSRKWFMISSDKSDDPQKFLYVSPRGSADILES